MNTVQDHNREAWDDRVRRKMPFTTTATEKDYQNPLRALDGAGWMGDNIAGKRVLALGAGGGRQGPLFAAAGALVTVVDVSPAMLEQDRAVAAERGLSLNAVAASMDDLSMFDDGLFDIVSQPVSTCYVPDVAKVFREVARITAPGGLYVSRHKQPTSLQIDLKPTPLGYVLAEPYYRAGPLPPAPASPLRESGTLEFLHRWEELLGGLCRAGFVIEDVLEPKHSDPLAPHGSWGHRGSYVAPYIQLKARRLGNANPTATRLWTP